MGVDRTVVLVGVAQRGAREVQGSDDLWVVHERPVPEIAAEPEGGRGGQVCELHLAINSVEPVHAVGYRVVVVDFD